MPRGNPIALTGAQTAAVRAGVGAALKDPYSAQFETIRAARSPDGVVMVCGYVNAKNSFGGYVGSRLFSGVLLSANGRFAIAGIANDAFTHGRVQAVCQQGGVAI